MKTKSLSGIFMSLFGVLALSFIFTASANAVSNVAFNYDLPVVPTFAIAAGAQIGIASLPMFFPLASAAGMLFSVPAGTLTCGDILSVMGKMEQMWQDSRVNAEYMPEAEVVKAIIENQTAKIGDITGKQEKNKKIKITWISDCLEDNEGDCTTACLPTGPELGIDCKEYEPTICKEKPFIVNEDTLRNSVYSKEEFIARGFLKRLKWLDEKFATAVVAFLEDSEGVSTFDGDQGTLAGAGIIGDSYIKVTPALWTADLIGYFKLVAKMNKMGMPFMIHGNNLYISSWKAEADAANADGKGNLNKFQQLKQYWDPFNIEGAFANPSSFLLDKGAVAFGAKWQYDESPTDYGKEGQRWSVASKSLPGVRYDVHYNIDCVDREIIHKFNIISKGGIYLSPVGCTGTDTGVIRFSKEV